MCEELFLTDVACSPSSGLSCLTLNIHYFCNIQGFVSANMIKGKMSAANMIKADCLAALVCAKCAHQRRAALIYYKPSSVAGDSLHTRSSTDLLLLIRVEEGPSSSSSTMRHLRAALRHHWGSRHKV